jgi:hypothetical protein
VVRCFFDAVPSLEWLVGPLMAEAPPPGVKSFFSCNRVKALLTFGEGAISSSVSAEESSPDPSPDPERRAATPFFFLRVLRRGEWSLSATSSRFRPAETEVVLRSLAGVAAEGGGTHCSSTMQSGPVVGEA